MPSLAPRTGVLGRRLAAHLLRRTTYGPTRKEIERFAAMTAEEALTELMKFPPLPDHPVDPKTGETWVLEGRNGDNSSTRELKFIVNSWYLHQIFSPEMPTSAFCRVVFFLHTSFTTSFNILEWSENHYYTLRLFMYYASMSYRDLAYKICLDNGMNTYLDIGESIKGNPNENFAREFLELFTIAKGQQVGDGDYTNYTEDDVRAAARLLTGFRRNDDWANPEYWDPETGFPQARRFVNRHDETDKEFSYAFQDLVITGRDTEEGMLEELSEFVDMIFAQDATGLAIARRMYRFFVRSRITDEVEADIIAPLAQTLRDTNYSVVEALTQLLSSQHFYDEDNQNSEDEIIGALIKSPLDLQGGIIRYFHVPIPDPVVDPFETYVNFYRWGMQDPLSRACFDLFAPPDVAGYEPVFQAPDYNRLWVSAKSVAARYEFADEHLDGEELLQIDVMAFVQDPENIPDFEGPDPAGVPGPHAGARIAQHLVSTLLEDLFPEPVDNDRFSYFLNEILLDNLSELNWAIEWDNYVASQDDSNVKPQIKRLIRSVLQSPEYQVG